MSEQPEWKYVAGLMFTDDRSRVALVKKLKGPPVNIGRWNGIGGKIEEGETPAVAMQREFEEETGIWCAEWEPFAVMRGPDWEVHWFRAFSDVVRGVTGAEAEPVEAMKLDLLDAVPLAQLVEVIVPLALAPCRCRAQIEVLT